MPEQNTQRKAIKAGNQLIHQTIYNQAGSVEKAFLEYIMNSIDAKATSIHITINSNGLDYSILDDGDGFGDASYSRKEKEKCIDEVFGQLGFDHGDDSENYRVYGKFGIGRAQLWAFSKNTWHTHDMMMDVDIKNEGLSYEIKQVKDFINGCKIVGRFYDKIQLNDILLIKKELAKFSAFAPIDVYFNDKIINRRMDSLKRSIIVKGLRIELKPSAVLRVYNQGIFIKEYSNYVFGTGGIVCSEIGYPFELNAARNDILQSKCKLFKTLKIALDKKLNTDSKKTKLTDDVRKSLLARIATGNYGDKNENLSKPLVKMINNRYISIKNILTSPIAITITKNRDNPLAEKIHSLGTANVLLSDFTDSLGIDDEDFITQLSDIKEAFPYEYHGKDPKDNYKSFEELAIGMKQDHTIIDAKKLTKRQKIFLEAINLTSVQSDLGIREQKRKIVIGNSETANGWTDGFSFIAINEELVDDIDRGAGYILKILNVIIHEYNHDEDNQDLHSLDFYKNFHDQVINSSHRTYFALTSFLKGYTSRLSKNNFVIVKKLNRSLNFFNNIKEVEYE